MKFRWWFVSMGGTAVLVLGGMIYLGSFLCVPVEQTPCVSLLSAETKIPAAHLRQVPTNSTNSTLPTVSALPTGGTYTSAQSVTLTASKPATIYYTTDGTTPTTSSKVYTGPISISTTTTLKFYAIDTAGKIGTVVSQTYAISNTIPRGTGGTVPPNGHKIDFTLSFVISPDFSKYGFDKSIGTPGANPDIKVHSGDTVTIHLSNPSKSFHAFGVVTDPNNPNSIVWNSAFRTADTPMKPGESGDVTFVAGTTGLYDYICTVPGHASLGMDGNFIVEP